ncbi:MAG: hypothetical protein ABI834_02435, partial [Ginsengibacter sp.]
GWNNFRSMVTGLDVLRPGKEMLLRPVIINKEIQPLKFESPVEKNFETEKISKVSLANDVILEDKNAQIKPDETNNENNANDVLPTNKNSTIESEDSGKITDK